MIPRLSPNYDGGDLQALLSPARPDAVGRLEAAFMEKTGHQGAVALKYGRTGLYLLLKALGAKNKKVIMPAYTCVVVAHAVVLSGNIPVFLDNAPGSFQPDPADYLQAIDSETVMIIPTHLFGIAEETRELTATVRQRFPHVFILQDCAHSFFCQDLDEVPVTTYGDGALFGMNISKLANTLRGGMLTLKDPQVAEAVRQVWRAEGGPPSFPLSLSLKARLYGLAAAFAFTPLGYEVVYQLTQKTTLLNSETQYYQSDQIDLPSDFLSPMFPIEAEMGLRSLRKWEQRIEQRRKLAQIYITELAAAHLPPEVLTLPSSQAGHTWSHFPILVPAIQRNAIKEALERQFRTEIGVIVDYSVPDLPAYQRLGAVPCPVATATVPRVLNLPLTFQESLWPDASANHKAKSIAHFLVNILSTGIVPESKSPDLLDETPSTHPHNASAHKIL
jgi:dTDP-4-amino-4,6-dideoxygalactose transaminase